MQGEKLMNLGAVSLMIELLSKLILIVGSAADDMSKKGINDKKIVKRFVVAT
jgi:hypothetical protein